MPAQPYTVVLSRGAGLRVLLGDDDKHPTPYVAYVSAVLIRNAVELARQQVKTLDMKEIREKEELTDLEPNINMEEDYTVELVFEGHPRVARFGFQF